MSFVLLLCLSSSSSSRLLCSRKLASVGVNPDPELQNFLEHFSQTYWQLLLWLSASIFGSHTPEEEEEKEGNAHKKEEELMQWMTERRERKHPHIIIILTHVFTWKRSSFYLLSFLSFRRHPIFGNVGPFGNRVVSVSIWSTTCLHKSPILSFFLSLSFFPHTNETKRSTQKRPHSSRYLKWRWTFSTDSMKEGKKKLQNNGADYVFWKKKRKAPLLSFFLSPHVSLVRKKSASGGKDAFRFFP